MVKLYFDIFETTTGNIIEVSASGEDIVDRARNVSRLGHVTESTPVLLGNLDEQGRFFEEWSFDLDIDPEWVKSHVPEVVKQRAWGMKANAAVRYRKGTPRELQQQINEAQREAREKEEEAARLEDDGLDASDAWADADDAEEELEELYERARKLSGSKQAENPRRPPKLWMKHCVAGVKAGGSAADPGAVCGALWYKKMSPSQRRAALRKEGKNMNENPPDSYKTWLMGVRRQLQRTGFGDATQVLRARERELRGLYVSGASTSDGARFVGETFRRGDYAANPSTESLTLLIGLGALALVGGVIWAVNRSKEGTGTKQPSLPEAAVCSFDEAKIKAFATSKGLRGTHLPQWDQAPNWSAYTSIVPADLPDGNWSPPLVVIKDTSFWTYDTSVTPAKPVQRDDLRNAYCAPTRGIRIFPNSTASAFLPGGI